MVWEIKINYSETVKSMVKESSLEEKDQVNFLMKSLPKYIWVASCYIGENKVFDFTFDATDVSTGMIGQDFLFYLTPDIKPILADFLKKNEPLLKPLFRNKAKELYYDFLLQQLEN